MVAGVAGGVSPSLRAGDVVVASEVRDDIGRTVLRAAAPLVAELRAHGSARAHRADGQHRSHRHRVDERERLARTGALAVDMESSAIVRALPTPGICRSRWCG